MDLVWFSVAVALDLSRLQGGNYRGPQHMRQFLISYVL
jgi:hypothetical protein